MGCNLKRLVLCVFLCLVKKNKKGWSSSNHGISKNQTKRSFYAQGYEGQES